MIELAVLIAIVVALVKFRRAISELCSVAETKTQSIAEEVTTSAVLERIELNKEFEKSKGENEIITHEELMAKLENRTPRRSN
jgi:hypothetical protein